jgi:catechol 2,3-dioxygenase-like lactoylglutathione lyase family enzyme
LGFKETARTGRRRESQEEGAAEENQETSPLGQKTPVIMAEPQIRGVAELKMISPEFAVPDVTAAAEFYRDKLGFKIHGYFLDPPVYAMVGRDSVEIHFGKSDAGTAASPNHLRRKGLGLDAYIWVNDLDSLHAELQSRGVKIIDPPTMRVYKCYEMVVEDNFGFHLAFSQDFSSARS